MLGESITDAMALVANSVSDPIQCSDSEAL
jgi:hypothetical protein